ncbi:putative uracil-DNA glycosylase [Hydrogenovibrio crunogenus]|uniref:Putative uracil-DNA glycosylase n=1 Tax=Hydrogenovibrio crunogenus TaxID=39765 RepID=A0A4P7NZC2_9GAMM|nr:uracil-DNA glycosylase family protein [Hydrogenovibrio crunogenus]QBZ83123.1 putative uracil-DNA glycosylase [Hydrogenovibrio crunogenus]
MKKDMDAISNFISELKKQKNTPTVSNPYLVAGVAENLEAYLDSMLSIDGKRVILVGEAPGYKGCKITGIPFTSGKVFEKVKHPLLLKIKEKLVLTEIEAENTATIVWNYLSTKTTTPLFWNSFPFHPHPEGNENKNRAPTDDEIEYGVMFLRTLYEIFKPELVAGIGNSGLNCAKRAFPGVSVKYIRHPSFGGKSEFIEGMNEII